MVIECSTKRGGVIRQVSVLQFNQSIQRRPPRLTNHKLSRAGLSVTPTSATKQAVC